MTVREMTDAIRLGGSGGGGGSSVNSVVTVTGTVAEPFGSIDPAELHTAITSNNATALMEIDATAIGYSNTLYLFAQPANRSFLDFQAVGGMSNSGCTCADASYSKTTGDLIAVAALTQGVYSLLTDYAALLTTTLTVIYHPLPDSGEEGSD